MDLSHIVCIGIPYIPALLSQPWSAVTAGAAGWPYLRCYFRLGVLWLQELQKDPSWGAEAGVQTQVQGSARVADLTKQWFLFSSSLLADPYRLTGLHGSLRKSIICLSGSLAKHLILARWMDLWESSIVGWFPKVVLIFSEVQVLQGLVEQICNILIF